LVNYPVGVIRDVQNFTRVENSYTLGCTEFYTGVENSYTMRRKITNLFLMKLSFTKKQNKTKNSALKKISSSLKLLSQSQQNFAEMILRWSPLRAVLAI
jgi:hypothetical protein